MTRAGEEFYHAALRVLDEMNHAESLLRKEGVLSGNIRISASDFGRQYLSPALLDFFSRLHPAVKSSVYWAKASKTR